MTVEVERKFVFDAESMEKLQSIGAKCIGQVQFRDQYFDSPDMLLTLQDFWLRRREGSWELKCPTVSTKPAENEAQSLCSRYREINSLPIIQSEVCRVLGHLSAESHSSHKDHSEDMGNTEWLEEFGLSCFAEFQTERCSYLLERGDGPVRVDLDRADFGYCVGEIEIMVPEGCDVDRALQRITITAEQLGVYISLPSCATFKIADYTFKDLGSCTGFSHKSPLEPGKLDSHLNGVGIPMVCLSCVGMFLMRLTDSAQGLSCEERVKGKMDVYLQRFRPEHYEKLLHAHVL